MGQDTLVTWCGTPEPHSGPLGSRLTGNREGKCETKEGVEGEGKGAQDKLGGKPRQQQGIPETRHRSSSQGVGDQACSEVLVGGHTRTRVNGHCLTYSRPEQGWPSS